MYKTKPKPATLNTLSSESSSFSADEPAHVPLKMYKTPLTKPKPASVNISSSESSSSSEDEPADGPLKISVAQLSHAIQILSLPDITAQQIPLYHSLSADKCIEMFNLMLLRVRLESYSDWPHNKGKEHFLDPLLVCSF